MGQNDIMTRVIGQVEERRQEEIQRLFWEEMGGCKPGFNWKLPHIEAQLVKMGLEKPPERSSKTNKGRSKPTTRTRT